MCFGEGRVTSVMGVKGWVGSRGRWKGQRHCSGKAVALRRGTSGLAEGPNLVPS